MIRYGLAALIPVFCVCLCAEEADKPEEKKKRAEGVQDNSFLIEEAYNQEPGVVQHIFTFRYDINRLPGHDDRVFNLNFTEEWPVTSQRHQLSYSIPFSSVETRGQHDDGLNDVMLNYRYQVLNESDTQPAFAPRLSFIFPTGSTDQGLGDGTFGYQVNLPVSKVLSDRWTVHFNAGATVLPRVRAELDEGGHVKRTLASYNLGESAIFAVTSNFNLMCETVQTWDQSLNGRGRREREFSAVVSPGMRYAINLPKVLDAQLVFGVAAPIGLTRPAPDFGVLGYISFEHKF